MPHASQGQCTSLTKPSRIKTLHTIMTDLHDTRQDRSSGGDDLATRSSISSSSTSVMTSALSPSTLEDAASSDTDSDIAKNSDDTVVKIERDTETASTSPTSLHDPTPDFLTSPVSSTESGSQAVAIPKRGRGRPRKHSDATLSPPSFKAKTFVRSKTGCLTCRKRKKKCDERKPECNLPLDYIDLVCVVADRCQASIVKRTEWYVLVILQKKNGNRGRKRMVWPFENPRPLVSLMYANVFRS